MSPHSLLLPFLFLLCISSQFPSINGDQKTWCVAKPSSDSKTLIENINYACSEVNCAVLNKGCPCYSPDNLINRASVAMNLYYQAKGRNPWNCDFKCSALVVITDPSYGNCRYE